jgi:serine phosphatase RsbU (regulator of sigma subunit)/lipopolysaccharide biosynthesis regulator YciM
MKKYFQILFIYFSLFFSVAVFGQNQKLIDSIRILLKNPKLTDHTRANYLSRLGWNVSYHELNEGLKYAEEALLIATRINDTLEMADAANVIGTIYMDLGNIPPAMDFLQKSINYNEQAKDFNRAAVSASNLSIIYNRRREFKKALDAGFKAYSYLKRSGSQSLVSACVNLGGTYMEMQYHDSAMFFLSEALETGKKYETDTLLESSIYNSMADVYLNKKDFAQAKILAAKAIAMVTDTTQYYYLAEHYITLAKIQLETKEYPQAILSASKALRWGKSIGVKEFEKRAYEILSIAYEKQNNPVKSYEFYKLYSQIKDTILNTENERQIKYMEGRFEIDKKQKEIELLNADKKLRDQKINHDKNLINAFIFGGVILLLALCLAVYAFANKRKANKKLHSLNGEIHRQKNQLLEKNTAITDSIQYARRIQTALLTSEDYIKKHLPDFFILNVPKDIVSGDFYWAYAQNEKMYFMCADCTGHGVPGAFMSLLGINFLNEIVIEKEITSPELVLGELRGEIIRSLNKQGQEETKDGMDCALCAIDLKNLQVQVASANNSVWIIRPPLSPIQADENGVLKMAPGLKFTEVRPDKMPVGKSPKEETPFTLKNYILKKGDCIFMFTDGFVDQFGGPKGKKMKYKILKETILKNCHLPMAQQKNALQKCFAVWKADFEQVDDVLVVGIKV